MLIYRGTSPTESPAPRPNELKVLEAAWFAPDEALRRVTHPSEHEELADALADPPAPIYRVY